MGKRGIMLKTEKSFFGMGHQSPGIAKNVCGDRVGGKIENAKKKQRNETHDSGFLKQERPQGPRGRGTPKERCPIRPKKKITRGKGSPQEKEKKNH